VTVIMAVRDEGGHVESALRSVVEQDYPPDLVDVVVAVGPSSDDTRAIVDTIAAGDERIEAIDNPAGIVSTGLNDAIERAKGDVIIRIDGHCEVEADFISASVETLLAHDDAWVVGGPIVHHGRTPFGRAAAYAMSSRFGVGNASHRFAGFEGYGESVQFPAFRRWVFDRVGPFDEAQVRNQDDELNFRIVQAGGRIFISPSIKHRYYVRDVPRGLFRQYEQYAFWRIPMLRKHRRPTTARQLAPPLFFAAMAALFGVGAVTRRPVVALALPIAYLAALAGIGVGARRALDRDAAVRVPLAVAILHTSYAVGWAKGAYALLFAPDAWAIDGSMAALSR
jgi:glycosyltransferase involved in cell wall biosynthesis